MITQLKGAVFSVPMFFTSDGEADFAALETYLQRCLKIDAIHCVFSMAYNTRYMQLTRSELLRVNELVCGMAQDHGKLSIVGHPVGLDLAGLKDYLKDVSTLNASAFSSLFPERYYGLDEPVETYSLAASDFGLGTILHEMKLISGFNGSLVDWPLDLLERLMARDEIVGIKEDSKEDSIAVPLIKGFAESKSVIVAGGGKRRARKLIPEGLQCWLNGSLMLYPEASAQVIAAYTGQDEAGMDKYEALVECPYFDGFVAKHGWHLAHKAALAYFGHCENKERAPLPTITPSAEELDLLAGIKSGLESFAG